MAVQKKVQGSGSQQGTPARPARQKPTMRVIPSTSQADPSQHRPPLIRVVGGERLTPQELKQRFASNLDRLIGIVGLSLKDAAQEVGIPYKLMRRLASAGVSRTDERNVESLTRIKDYLVLPTVDDLWRDDLLPRLLTTDEAAPFVEKFRNRLLAERERRVAAARVIGHEEVSLVGRALGVEVRDQPPVTVPIADKVAAILASPKGAIFLSLIDDYFDLASRSAVDSEKRGSATSA
jgi:hypothetical protein